MKNNLRSVGVILGVLALCATAIGLLYPFIEAILLSLKDYKPFVGLVNSEFVGLDNFLRFFSYKYASRLLTNTVVISFLALLFGAVCVFVSTLAVSSFKNIFAKSAVAFLFALPLAIPADILIYTANDFIPLYESGAHLWVVSAIGNALPIAALFSLGALFAKGGPVKSALKLTVAFIAVKLVLLFVENFGFQYLMTSPATYDYTDTMSTYIYMQGLQSNAFSYGSAVGIINVLMNLIPAAVGCAIILMYMKPEPHLSPEKRASSPTVFTAIAAIVPVALTVTAIASVLEKFFYFDALWQSYVNSIIIAVVVTVIAAALAFLISYAVTGVRGIGFVIVCILCLMMENRIGQYVASKILGLVNTHIGVIIMNLRIVPVLALVFAVFTKMCDSSEAKLAVLPLSAGAAFAFSWGDITAPLILLNDQARFPLSVMARQILQMGIRGDYETPARSLPNLSLYVIIPIIVLAICVAAGAILIQSREKTE